MNPDTIASVITSWGPVVTAVLGMVGVCVSCIAKIKKAAKGDEDRKAEEAERTRRLEAKMDIVLQENAELKERLNQKYLDEHKIYTRSKGRKE